MLWCYHEKSLHAPKCIRTNTRLINFLCFLHKFNKLISFSNLLLQFSIVILILFVAQLGFGLYGLFNYDQLIEDGLTETMYAAKDQKELQKAWETLQHEVNFY